MTRRNLWIAASVIAATLATLAIPAQRMLVWNVSASLPTGLYIIRDKPHRYVGERVAITPPPALRAYLNARGYLPSGVPLLKRVAALRGQRVCRLGLRVTIDGRNIGFARARDRHGRALPRWSGCHRLRDGQLFLMNPAAPDSFDGRYFGVLDTSVVIGRATPIWTDERGNGRHIWLAPQALEVPHDAQAGD